MNNPGKVLPKKFNSRPVKLKLGEKGKTGQVELHKEGKKFRRNLSDS